MDHLPSDTVRQAGPSRPGFHWSLPNLLAPFATWEAEIALAQSQGYELITDPSASTSIAERKIYVMRINAKGDPFVGEWHGSIGEASRQSYPLYTAGPDRKKQLEQEAQAKNDLNCGVWFCSACSGLWYRTPAAVGGISQICVNGVSFYPKAKGAQ